MNLSNLKLSDELVPANYLKLALEAQKSKDVAVQELMEKRKIPENGWPDLQIEELVHRLASLDSNNFSNRVGVGEREARIACDLVARRHYNFGHGIGRSGDLLESQPKAAGSTLLAKLTNAMLLALCRMMGMKSVSKCFLMPMATGMTLTMCLLALRKNRPLAKYVLWSRIDQKSCFKCITAAGLQPVIIELNDNMSTDCERFAREVSEKRPETILCLLTTTSCFAPRDSDNLLDISRLAKAHDVPHVVNNAYGLQSFQLTEKVEAAMRLGGIDLIVQSADKNLMVPVGGAIVAGRDAALVEAVAKTYPGRATSSHTLDVFMTLLSMGRKGYLERVRERRQMFDLLRSELEAWAASRGEKLLGTGRNPISLALSLQHLSQGDLSKFGSMLYTRQVSGARVVVPGAQQIIDGHQFKDWGSHRSGSQIPYLTVAASLGISREDIAVFMKKLRHCWQDFEKQQLKQRNGKVNVN